MKLTVLIIAATLGLAGLGRSVPPRCSAPAPKEHIAWDKLNGEWHVMLDRAVGIENEYGCFSYSNLQQTDEGFSTVFKICGSDGSNIQKIPSRFIAHGSGNFIRENKYMSLEEQAQWLRSQDPGAREADIQDEISWINHDLVYHTDYENYLLEMACAEDGSKHLWVYFRTTRPEVEDILRVHNKLVDIGCGWSGVRLSPAPCWGKPTA